MPRKRDYAAEYARRKARAQLEGYPSFWARRRAGERVRIITAEGLKEVNISNRKTRSEYATYLNYIKAVFFYEDAESIAELAKFEGRTFKDGSGNVYPYITDRKLLIRLYDDGKIDMEDFYVEMAR